MIGKSGIEQYDINLDASKYDPQEIFQKKKFDKFWLRSDINFQFDFQLVSDTINSLDI